MEQHVEVSLDGLIEMAMQQFPKKNKNNIFWKKGTNEEIIVYQCNPTDDDSESQSFETATDLLNFIITTTIVVFKNKKMITELFEVDFNQLTEPMLHHFCTDLFTSDVIFHDGSVECNDCLLMINRDTSTVYVAKEPLDFVDMQDPGLTIYREYNQ